MSALTSWPLAVVLFAALDASVGAQALPPIYDKAPIRLAGATTIAEFPKGTFLENLAIGADGTLFVTSYLEGRVYRIDAAGKTSEWTTIDGTIAGIALNPDGSAIVSGWIKGKEPAVFRVGPDGANEILVPLPGAMFPNGVVRLSDGRFLVADSYLGVIWEVDAERRSARIWLQSELLGRADEKNATPAVNGLKVFRGALYASNTARQTLVRVPIVAGAAGTPEVVRQQLGIDDLAFGDSGTLYAAMHVYNSLVGVDANGGIVVLAGLAQGMAGSTAVAVGKPANGASPLYVVTNGGMSLPPQGGVQPAKVIRIDLASQ